MIIDDRGAEIFCHAFVVLGQFDKFYCGFGKRGEHDGGTPVSELPADILHHLRVVTAYGGELRVEVGQPDVEIRIRRIYVDYLCLSLKNLLFDEPRAVAYPRFEEPVIEPGILGFVEPYRILVYRPLLLWGTTTFPFYIIHKHDVSE
nr:hypothetical protein [Bacteroides acidifaciens]